MLDRRSRLSAVVASAMQRVNTRARVPPTKRPSQGCSFFAFVVPDADVAELRARAEERADASRSERAATLEDLMCGGAKAPAT